MSSIITYVLEFEGESEISAELAKLREVATQSSDLRFQNAIHKGFLYLHQYRLTFKLLSALKLQRYLPTILWTFILNGHYDVGDWDLRLILGGEKWSSRCIIAETYYELIRCISRDKGYVEILLSFPIPCQEWFTNAALFRHLLDLEVMGFSGMVFKPGNLLLGVLSDTSEFRNEATGMLKGGRWNEVDFTLWPVSYNFRLARFWGNLALLQDIDDTTRLRLVKIATDWGAKLSEYYTDGITCSADMCPFSNPLNFASDDYGERLMMTNNYLAIVSMGIVGEVMRTVTIISRLHANSALFSLSPARWMHAESTWTRCITYTAEKHHFHVDGCRGQAEAYQRMKMYDEALVSLDLAQQACDALRDAAREFPERLLSVKNYMSHEIYSRMLRIALRNVKLHTVLVRALSKDYQGAMDLLRQFEGNLSCYNMDTYPSLRLCIWGNRAVLLRLSGETSKSIQDFDKSLELLEVMNSQRSYMDHDPRIQNWLKCCLLEHRAYAKHLMEDLEESKSDREAAAECRSSKDTGEPIAWEFLTTNYSTTPDIGVKHWLLQLPISYD